MARYRRTLGRAAARVALKKIEPARATATRVSAPMASAWVSARRAKGLCPGRASRDWLILPLYATWIFTVASDRRKG